MKDASRSHITVAWDPPVSDGGAPLKGFNVERKDPRTGRWVKLNRTPVGVSAAMALVGSIVIAAPVLQPCEFTDDKVQGGKDYEYRVTAVNDGGESDPSDASGPIKAKPLRGAESIGLSQPTRVALYRGAEDQLRGTPRPRDQNPRRRTAQGGRSDLRLAHAHRDVAQGRQDHRRPAGESLPPSPAAAATPTARLQVQQEDEEEAAKLNVLVSKRSDSGVYTVAVKNDHGEDSGDFKVIVLGNRAVLKPGNCKTLLQTNPARQTTSK